MVLGGYYAGEAEGDGFRLAFAVFEFDTYIFVHLAFLAFGNKCDFDGAFFARAHWLAVVRRLGAAARCVRLQNCHWRISGDSHHKVVVYFVTGFFNGAEVVD